MHLDDKTQKRVKELNSKINNLAVDFMKNLNDVTTALQFTAEQLNGLSQDFLQSLKKCVNIEFVLISSLFFIVI